MSVRILPAAMSALLGGQRFSLRLRLKPSWSGRVYGSYNVGPRHFLLAFLVVGSTVALFLRLLELNLAEIPGEAERATLQRCVAHGAAFGIVRAPERERLLEQRVEELDSLGHRIETALGVGPSVSGLGRIDDAQEVPTTTGAELLGRLVADTGRLARRFDRLGSELLSNETEFRYRPSVIPLAQAEFFPTSPFGHRVSPFTNLPELHRGQDLAAEMYSKIVATADGVVARVDTVGAGHMGRYLVIDHGGRFETYYGHCERILVAAGDEVKRHQIVAEVGNTGRSTGPHIHYEVRIAGAPHDPRRFMVLDSRYDTEELRSE